MKIEVGKSYVTVGGSNAIVDRYIAGAIYPFKGTIEGRPTSWNLDGYWYASYSASDNDLVSEYDKENEEYCLKILDELEPIFEDVSSLLSYATSTQIGGDHYSSKDIQPIDYIHANKLGFCEGNVVKYVTRHKDKNGKQDIEKAIHYLQIILQQQYS